MLFFAWQALDLYFLQEIQINLILPVFVSVADHKEQTVQSSFSQLPVWQFTSFHALIKVRILMS